jgi:1,4-alpha-glucan branching enzyme
LSGALDLAANRPSKAVRKGGRALLKKNYSKTGRICRVTFELSPEETISEVSLCGEFNEWEPSAHPMMRRKDGRFSITVSLEAGRNYRFRYLLDGQVWENDWEADGYVPNVFGSEDSLAKV